MSTRAEKISKLLSDRLGVYVRVSYRRRIGAWAGRGWYMEPFGQQERRLGGSYSDIINGNR